VGSHKVKKKQFLISNLRRVLNAVSFLLGTSPASEGFVISAAKEESNGGEESVFLDSEFREYSNVSCSFLPIAVKYS
jgi:hypothetical protein